MAPQVMSSTLVQLIPTDNLSKRKAEGLGFVLVKAVTNRHWITYPLPVFFYFGLFRLFGVRTLREGLKIAEE